MDKPTNISWQAGEVSRSDREERLQQFGVTVWLTGLSGSGKSTIAVALESELTRRGKLCYRLDGDNLRHGLCADLSFAAADRTENIRRAAELAKLMADAGLICIASFISPFEKDRAAAKRTHNEAGIPFVEVYVECPLEVVEARDPKGLYRLARAGKLPGFTGIGSPYEAPELADVVLNSDRKTVEEEVAEIIRMLRV